MARYVVGIVKYGTIEVEAKDGIEAIQKANSANPEEIEWTDMWDATDIIEDDEGEY